MTCQTDLYLLSLLHYYLLYETVTLWWKLYYHPDNFGRLSFCVYDCKFVLCGTIGKTRAKEELSLLLKRQGCKISYEHVIYRLPSDFEDE